MTAFKCLSFVPCVIALTASLAAAQPGPGSLDHGYMTASAGASFSDERSATFGVEIAERMGRRAQAYVAFTYFDDLFNNRAAGDLTSLASYLSRINGQSWALSGRDRGLAFSGGAKYLISQGPSVRPYVGGGPGVLNIQRTITEASLGNVSDPFLAVFGAPDGYIDARDTSTFKPFAEFIAGVGIASGRTYVDVGYRFRKVFQSAEPFSFSQFSVGVGMRF